MDEAKFYIGARKNSMQKKLQSSFYKQRGEQLNIDSLAPFRDSKESKNLMDFIGESPTKSPSRIQPKYTDIQSPLHRSKSPLRNS